MIQAVDKKYCKNDLVQLMPYTGNNHLIVSNDEIMLLKEDDKVLINKYTNHLSRNLFPYHEKEQNDSSHFTEIYEYNKLYLDFIGSPLGVRLQKLYFFKGSNRALVLEEPISLDMRKRSLIDAVTVPAREGDCDRYESILNKSELDELFNKDNYDAIYVFDANGNIHYVNNEKENINIGNKNNPSEESLEEFILTSKDGRFDLKWFKLDSIEKDKSKIIIKSIPIIEPTIDTVLNYTENNYINKVPEPTRPVEDFSEVHTEENQRLANNSILSLLEENEKPIEDKESLVKCLKKRFKRK